MRSRTRLLHARLPYSGLYSVIPRGITSARIVHVQRLFSSSPPKDTTPKKFEFSDGFLNLCYNLLPAAHHQQCAFLDLLECERLNHYDVSPNSIAFSHKEESDTTEPDTNSSASGKSDAGQMTGQPLIVPLQILGSYNRINNSWLWIWGNEQADVGSRQMKKCATQMRSTFGGRSQTLPEFSLPLLEQTPEWIGTVLAAITTAELRYDGYYSFPFGDGAGDIYVVVKNNRIKEHLNWHTSEMIPQLVEAGAMGPLLIDHRRLVEGFFDYHRMNDQLKEATAKTNTDTDSGSVLEVCNELQLEFTDSGYLSRTRALGTADNDVDATNETTPTETK